MKRFLLVLVSAVAVSAPALAQDSGAITRTRKWLCDGCHIDQLHHEADYPHIARKYANEPFAANKIAYIILRGKGKMPPTTQVSPKTARDLAIWILSLNQKVN